MTVFACHADPTDDGGDTATSAEEEAFVCETPGKLFGVVNKGGCRARAWQVGDIPVICDNGASCHMSYSSTGMLNYRETNAFMRTASGKRFPIEGYGDLPLTFRCSKGELPVLLRNVAHVPSLSYHLFSLRAAADNGHTYTGTRKGVTLNISFGETLFFP